MSSLLVVMTSSLLSTFPAPTETTAASWTTLAFDGQHTSVRTGKDWARTYTDAVHRVAAHKVQAEHTIDALQDSFFEHEVSPTPAFFSGLEEQFHVAAQLGLA